MRTRKLGGTVRGEVIDDVFKPGLSAHQLAPEFVINKAPNCSESLCGEANLSWWYREPGLGMMEAAKMECCCWVYAS